ncbi:MAG: helix-turn-helix transcriptional regulator [Magnetospirillum sp.]|nr:helix-turn-helix transcriptional regulator [Magnetospirillum sp.]
MAEGKNGGAGRAHPVDVHVGSRVRLRRTLLGLTQGKLAEAVGLTFQQVQKYERGANRISASRLYDFSRVLDVPISFFFDDMPEELGRPVSGVSAHLAESDAAYVPPPDAMNSRETMELVRAYYRIPGVAVRRRVYDLAKALAGVPET